MAAEQLSREVPVQCNTQISSEEGGYPCNMKSGEAMREFPRLPLSALSISLLLH